MQKIAFLVGSGLSSSAGMPSTTNITDRVLSPEGPLDQPERTLQGQEEQVEAQHRQISLDHILGFLRCLKQEVDRYYADHPEHQTDYEDLYYAASQIHDSECGEYDNPAIQPFIERIQSQLQELPGVGLGDNQIPLGILAKSATHYIRDVVWHMLIGKPESVDPMASIKGACQDPQLQRIDLFSLNHDLVLERYLESENIEFTDGFDAPRQGIRYWNPDLFRSSDFHVRLFKLHGSVNWFRLHDDRSGELIGIPTDWKYRPIPNATPAHGHPAEGTPLFLAGTFNKMLQYINDIYADLHYQFRYGLRESHHLFVCGYSFGDKGINTRIMEWMHKNNDRVMIVAHPDPADLKLKARPGIARHWEAWEAQGRLHFLAKGIEEVSWDEIRQRCVPSPPAENSGNEAPFSKASN